MKHSWQKWSSALMRHNFVSWRTPAISSMFVAVNISKERTKELKFMLWFLWLRNYLDGAKTLT